MLHYQCHDRPGDHTPARVKSHQPVLDTGDQSINLRSTTRGQIDFTPETEILLPDCSSTQNKCCPLADSVCRLHAEVETLLRRRKRLKNTIPILGALYALFADIDQNYDRVKKSLVAQMAQLQIESISECTQRQLLVRELKCAFEAANVFETETLPDIIMQVLADRTVLEENPYLNRVLSAHPEIARAAHKIIEFRQPNLDRFQALRQQIQHSSNHRITGLQAVADSLDRYGFNDFSKEIRLEALGVENRLARR